MDTSNYVNMLYSRDVSRITVGLQPGKNCASVKSLLLYVDLLSKLDILDILY